MLARSRTIFVGLATVVLTAAAIGCAQLAPTVGFIPFSLRSGGMDLESATVYSLPPRYGLIFALCPDLFGVAGRYWGQWSQTELAMYLGLAPVALLPIALRRWRLLNVSFLWFILVASLVLAFGSHTVAFSIAYEHLPGLSFFRVPGRFLYLYSFAGAALAAVALHELTELGRRTYFAIVAFNAAAWIIIALACYRLLTAPQLVDRLVRIAFDDSAPRQILARLQLVEHFKSIEGVHEHYWHLSLRIIAIWALILAAVLLARMKPKTAQIAIAAIAAIDILLFARALPVWGLAGAGQEHTAAPSWISSLQKSRYRGELPHSLLPPNIGMLHRLKIWDGYDPLLPQLRYTQLTSAGEGNRERLQELFAIRYVATPAPQATDNYHSALNSIVIQLRDDVPPRALVVDHATIVSNEREALERVLNDEFNIHRSVVLEPLDRESVQSAPTTAEPNVQQSRADADRPRPEPVVQWDTDDPDKLVLRVWSDRPAWLVVQDAYWPKWRGKVNGEVTAIRRANFYFRAVPVPRGDSVVEMQYRDPVAWAAILVSVAGLGCVLVLTVREWARRRRLRSGIAVELSTSVPEM